MIWIKLPTDTDLSINSFYWAWSLAGRPEKYHLWVHAYAKHYAQAVWYWTHGPNIPPAVFICYDLPECGWELWGESGIVVFTLGG